MVVFFTLHFLYILNPYPFFDVELDFDEEVRDFFIADWKRNLYRYLLQHYETLAIATFWASLEVDFWMKCCNILVCIESYLISITPLEDFGMVVPPMKSNIIVVIIFFVLGWANVLYIRRHDYFAVIGWEYVHDDLDRRLTTTMAALSFTMTMQRILMGTYREALTIVVLSIAFAYLAHVAMAMFNQE